MLARTNSFFYLERALRYAVDHNLGDVISSSIEAGEACSPAYVEATHDDIQKATAEHITVVSISGDQGAAQFSQPPACGDHKPFFKDVSTFGSDPLVTCVGAPQWSGITALADQLAGARLGFINGAIYRIGKSQFYSKAFHDITFGNNTFHTTNFSETIPGYNTRKGWDPVTGWGTPRVSNLVPLLLPTLILMMPMACKIK